MPKPTKPNKYSEFEQSLGFVGHSNDNTLLSNLLKPPRKDKGPDMPHTENPMKNGSHQADLLFLPDDNGYKYALVVVDLATRITDAEPLKTKTSKVVLDAIKKIYKRKYLKLPDYLEVDAGSEFRDVFEKYFKNKTTIRIKEPGRHRQQSVVETRNGLIGKTLNKRMVAEEVNTGVQSTDWVQFLPKVIESINKFYTEQAKHIDGNEPIKGNKTTLQILPEGTMVRTQLDNPTDYLTNARLHGKFRMGDVRWTKDPKPITQIYLRPDEPPMYKVGTNANVAYTKNQLQVVKGNETKPSINLQTKFNVDRLIRRFKKGNKVMFRVKWSDGSETDEPRSQLNKDIPQMIKDFEKAT